MKKNFFRVVAMSALLAFGVNGAMAQRSYECPELNPEWKAMADQIVELNMEDPEKANKVFMKLSRKIKKSKEDLVAVGTYFLENNNYPAASQCSKMVYEEDATYIPGLMFCGEVAMKAQRWGEAGQKFDEVLSIDPENISALKRNAFVYKNVNPHVAIDALKKIKEVDPSYADADKLLGDIYYKLNMYKDAVDSYELYFKNAPKDETLDIRSCENFLLSLYSQAMFDRIIDVAKVVLPFSPKDIIFHRMDFFAKVNKIGESIDVDGAIKVAEEAGAYMSDTDYPETEFNTNDYEYLAALNKEKGDFVAVAAAYEKALEKDSEKLANYKELSKAYNRAKDPDKAIATYQTYLDKKSATKDQKVDVIDYYTFGQQYMRAAASATDSVKRVEYIAGGDAAFNKVLELKPGYYKAVMMQAQMHITNPGAAEEAPKALYEKALSMMPETGDGESTEDEVKAANNYRLIALAYLAVYYVQTDDFDNCRVYVDKMLQIDPSHPTAVQFDSALKEMGK